MRHKKRSTTAKPLRASGIRPAGSATNWEKARDARGPRSQRKKQPRSPKKVQKTREVRRKRGRQRKESDPKANKGNEAASSREAAMDAELRAFAERVALSPQEKQLRTRVFEDVRDLISSAFQDATVQLYGSSSTGLDTFRSDLDITVGNISLSAASQPWPTVVVVDEEDEVVEEQEPTGVGEDEDERLESCARLSTNQPVEEEEESSFSLNLALPVGTAASEDNADITRRVQPTAASHWNPTLRRRKIRVLRALQFLLKAQRPHFQVKCLHKAKIPILMVLDTKTKLSIDIGVNREAFEASEHGRSTSLAHRLQNTLGAPFTTMVMFLKEFLHQFELDKPFTGGLGSFRVYMMVAYIFQRYSSKRKNKPQPPVSTLLLAFFELFGNKKLPNFLHEETQLPLPLGDGGHMDFGGVFRIADCVDTFAMAFDILRSTGNIGSIIYEERLEKDRKKCQKSMEQNA